MGEIPALLDHLVLATPDLASTVADFARRTGVTPAPGGAHVELGTRNPLVGLGGRRYLEIVGPDAGRSRARASRPAALEKLPAPRVLAWAIRPPDLDAAVVAARARGHDPGEVRPMARHRPDGTLLRWRLTDGAHPSGLVPFLIDWGASAHPAAGLPVAPLRSLAARAPDPGPVRPLLAALGVELPLTTGPAGLAVTLDTPRGPVTFG